MLFNMLFIACSTPFQFIPQPEKHAKSSSTMNRCLERLAVLLLAAAYCCLLLLAVDLCSSVVVLVEEKWTMNT
jgi:hypothetical protein